MTGFLSKLKRTAADRTKALLRGLLASAGYGVSPMSQVRLIDLRDCGNDPGQILYRSHLQPTLITAPVLHGRGLPIFSLDRHGHHPFVRAVASAISRPESERHKIISNTLETYYRLVQPANAAQLLGVSHADAPRFADQPSWAALMPWDSVSLDEWCIDHQLSVARENLDHGQSLTVADGWSWVGPVSRRKLEVEVFRLKKVLDSILASGYKRNDGQDGDILAAALVNEQQQWRWQALTGQHRAVVLAGLGYETIPIRIVRIVFRAQSRSWPNVANSLFSEASALALFDRCFSGEEPPITGEWVRQITEVDGEKPNVTGSI